MNSRSQEVTTSNLQNRSNTVRFLPDSRASDLQRSQTSLTGYSKNRKKPNPEAAVCRISKRIYEYRYSQNSSTLKRAYSEFFEYLHLQIKRDSHRDKGLL